MTEMPLGYGRDGYKMEAVVHDLYDKRNWVNGTFDEGPDDGSESAGDDDSSYALNWTFGSVSTENSNPFSGNYLNGVGDTISESALELRMDDTASDANEFDQYDRCWWETSFQIPRDDVLEAEVSLMIYPYTQYYPSTGGTDPNFGTHWSIQVYVNDVSIDDKNLLWLQNAGSPWVPLTLQLTNWLDNPTVFPAEEKDMSLKIQLIRNGPTFLYSEYGTYHIVYIDNVSLTVKAEAKPEQLGLNINQTNYVNDIDWSTGSTEITGNWNGSQSQLVYANYSTDEIWTLDDYEVDFETDLNLYATKHSPETNYETNTESIGTSFSVINNSLVSWESYAYINVPTGYEETEMKIEFPTDVNITWISSAQQPSINVLSQCVNSTPGILKVNVTSISPTPDGFWKLKAISSNYMENLDIYSNSTGIWTLDNEFISGEYINITAEVFDSPLITSYIQQTKAYLYIRFPNGSIWNTEIQAKSPNANGDVYFDLIKIPDLPPKYEVGEYEAIIMWNNSYSNLGLNETGIILKKFIVKHSSTLTPVQAYYEDVFENSLIDLKVELKDTVNNYPIENAEVYFKNFTNGIQYFTDIGAGFYLFDDFNVSGANTGNNTLIINATSPSYTDSTTNFTINVIRFTTLTAEEYPYLQVQWNINFTIHLNFNETLSGAGIITTPTNNWLGETNTIMVMDGVYEIECNTSVYEVNKLHSLLINVDEIGYESQSILIKIDLLEREAYINDIFLYSVNHTEDKSIQINSGDLLNITVAYRDVESNNFIRNATVKLIGETLTKTLNESIAFNHYNITLNSTTDLDVGVTFLSIVAQKQNYTFVSELLTIYVGEIGTNYSIYLNGTDKTRIPTLLTTVDKDVVIDFTFRESAGLKKIINDALVSINGSGISELLIQQGLDTNYTVTINKNTLNRGINFLTIYVTKVGHLPQSLLLTIQIAQIQTNMTLYIDGEDLTEAPSIKREIEDVINITVIYYELLGAQEFILGASINLTGPGFKFNISKHDTFDQYNLTLDTNDLNYGVNFLTIYGLKPNYQPQSLILTVDITPKETLLNVSLDEVDRTADVDKSIILKWNELLNVSITYRLDPSKTHFGGATVTIEGGGFSDILVENGVQYNLTVNTTRLGVGVHYLTILAYRNNYESQSVVIRVEVNKQDSASQLFIDGVEKSDNPIISVYTNTTVNITMIFKDLNKEYDISGATINFTGGGLPLGLGLVEVPVYGHYFYSLNTSDLVGTTNFLTVFAQADNYTSQEIYFSIVIIQTRTDYKLFLSNTSSLNAEDKTSKPSIKVVVNDYFNITIKYFNNNTKIDIANAELKLSGQGFDEILTYNATYMHYTIIIDSDDARLSGVNFLKIVAQKDGYQPQDIDIQVEIINRQTEMKIYLNGEDKTLNNNLKIAYGKLLTFTVNYTDVETNHTIIGATVSILGEGLLTNLTYGSMYSITINTAVIDIGMRFLSIFAHKTNYHSLSVRFNIEVVRIQTDIELLDYDNNEINIKPGEDITIRVQLNDLDFGGVITGARVEYTWEHGDGEMDEVEDGIYEVTLEAVPEGTFTFVITVYAEDKYEFKRKDIDINSIRPPEDLTLLIILATTIPILTAFGSLLAYRQFRIIKTPTFVKKARAIKGVIKKSHVMPVTYVYPYRNEAFVKKYKKTWDKLGISLEEVTGLEYKEKKIAKVKAKKSKMNSFRFKKQKPLKKK